MFILCSINFHAFWQCSIHHQSITIYSFHCSKKSPMLYLLNLPPPKSLVSIIYHLKFFCPKCHVNRLYTIWPLQNKKWKKWLFSLNNMHLRFMFFMAWQFIYYCWISFHYMNVPHFVYPFTYWVHFGWRSQIFYPAANIILWPKIGLKLLKFFNH